MRATERGGVGTWLLRLVVTTIIGVLSAALLYLVSERNYQRFRLQLDDAQTHLVVERGRFFPVGYDAYQPEGDRARIYAPIPLPHQGGETAPAASFNQQELDRTLFSILSGWIHQRFDNISAQTPQDEGPSAEYYVQRIDLLPGISEEQRSELRTLRADLAFYSAEAKLQAVERYLNEAETLYRQAIELRSSKREMAEERLLELRDPPLAMQVPPIKAPALPGAQPEVAPESSPGPTSEPVLETEAQDSPQVEESPSPKTPKSWKL